MVPVQLRLRLRLRLPLSLTGYKLARLKGWNELNQSSRPGAMVAQSTQLAAAPIGLMSAGEDTNGPKHTLAKWRTDFAHSARLSGQKADFSPKSKSRGRRHSAVGVTQLSSAQLGSGRPNSARAGLVSWKNQLIFGRSESWPARSDLNCTALH